MWTVSTLALGCGRDRDRPTTTATCGRRSWDRARDGAGVRPGRGRAARGGPPGGRLPQRGLPPLRRPGGAARRDRWAGMTRCSPRSVEPLGAHPAAPRRRAPDAGSWRSGRAYVDFALPEPGLFGVAFTGHPDEPEGKDPDGPYALLGQALDEMVATGRPGPAVARGGDRLLVDGPRVLDAQPRGPAARPVGCRTRRHTDRTAPWHRPRSRRRRRLANARSHLTRQLSTTLARPLFSGVGAG